MLVDPDLCGSRLLLCEQDDAHVSSLHALLGRAGLRGVEAIADSRRVLPALAGGRDIRLLLLGASAVPLSGIEVIELLGSELGEDERVPIILFAGPADRAAKLRALELGAIDVILRPYDEAEVVLRVRNALRIQDTLLREREPGRYGDPGALAALRELTA